MNPTPPSPSRRCRSQRGAISAFLAPAMVGLLALAGLAVDGGAALAARHRAVTEARAAARAGAAALAAPQLRGAGMFIVDPAAAQTAARAFLAQAGHPGDVLVTGDRVEVHVEFPVSTTFLGLVGLREMRVEGRGLARALHGVSAEEGSR